MIEKLIFVFMTWNIYSHDYKLKTFILMQPVQSGILQNPNSFSHSKNSLKGYQQNFLVFPNLNGKFSKLDILHLTIRDSLGFHVSLLYRFLRGMQKVGN